MFSSVILESTDRIRQASTQLENIKNLESDSDRSFTDLIKIQKGLFFISLYAAIEYTITASTSQFLTALQTIPKKPTDYKKYILCTALNPQFNALTSGTKKGIWQKKAQLIDCLFSEEIVEFDNAVFPTDGTNIAYDQIDEIWKLFHLPEPVVPDEVHPWILKEIKDHRNAIAHGREKADFIGGRFTSELLESRLNVVNLLCSHIISAFEEHFRAQTFLNNNL
jgi:hypothetical protein